MKSGFAATRNRQAPPTSRAKNDDTGEGASCVGTHPAALHVKGRVPSVGSEGGVPPLARSYRGPDNVAGSLTGGL